MEFYLSFSKVGSVCESIIIFSQKGMRGGERKMLVPVRGGAHNWIFLKEGKVVGNSFSKRRTAEKNTELKYGKELVSRGVTVFGRVFNPAHKGK